MFAQLSRRARLTFGVLAAVLLLTTGTAIGYLIPQLRTPGEDSIDAGFARDMSTHHGQAVEMAMFAYRLGTTDRIRNMGYDIAASQQWQIGQMQTWLTEWHLSPVPPNGRMAWMPGAELLPDGRMPGMASDAELNQLKSATGRAFDILFCQLMLRHHLGGVHMAEEVLKVSDNERVVRLAERIMAGQRNEVTIFNDLLTRWGAKPLP
jgi:uncharacterized protein (DUF305 family)